ncbi:MAG: DNA-3-methyladenine glycosylase I [Nitrospirota bacterium]
MGRTAGTATTRSVSHKVTTQAASAEPMLCQVGTKPKNDNGYFEAMTKVIFRSGLSWTMIEDKWPNFRKAFGEFAIANVARFGEPDVDRLMKDTGIVRNYRKIIATIDNARELQTIQLQGAGPSVLIPRWVNGGVLSPLCRRGNARDDSTMGGGSPGEEGGYQRRVTSYKKGVAAMSELHHTITINALPGKVWNVLADLEAVQRYNPTVSRAQYISSNKEGLGASRQCDLKPKGVVKERVIAWEPNHAIALELYESPWPLVFMRWRTEVKPEGAGTVVSQRMEYRVKFGVLGALMDRLVMRRTLDRTIADVFVGLKRFVETGEQASGTPR